jgi:hypothetical protein
MGNEVNERLDLTNHLSRFSVAVVAECRNRFSRDRREQTDELKDGKWLMLPQGPDAGEISNRARFQVASLALRLRPNAKSYAAGHCPCGG